MRSIITALLLIFLWPTFALAQGSAPRLLVNSSANLGTSFEYWTSDNSKISEWVLPLVVQYAASGRLSFTLINQPTAATLQRPVQKYSLSGLTETRLGASFLFGGEKFLATAGVNFPTGKTELDQEELAVAQVIPLRELGLRTKYFGGGLDWSAGLSAAFPLGDWGIGAGAGYWRLGEFNPVAGSGAYDPGEELTLTLGFDRAFGEESKLLADVTYSVYTADTFEGTDYFKSGPRIILEARFYFPWRALDLSVIVRDRLKGKNHSLQALPLANVLRLREETANSHGNELEIIVQSAYSLSERSALDGLLQAKIYSTNELGTNGADIFALGGGWRRTLSSVINIELGAKFSIGRLKGNGKSSGITGVELNGGIVYNF